MPRIAKNNFKDELNIGDSMNIEQLKNRDYYLVIDKSGSMEEMDTPTGQSRWKYLQESVVAISKKLNEFDPDGITVVPFATTYKAHANVTPATVTNLFAEHSPMGSTILAPALQWVFDDYNAAKKAGKTKANGAIALIVTDGQPQDEAQVAKTIVNFTKTLENGDSEFGMSFLQIGKDAAASAFLKRLDDSLTSEGAKFDIVDTKTMEELETIGLIEALTSALTD